MLTVIRETVDGSRTVVCRKPREEAIRTCRKLAETAKRNGSNHHYYVKH